MATCNYYIPKKILVGLESSEQARRKSFLTSKYRGVYGNAATSTPGIVVCNFCECKWTNDSGFKYLTGYNRGMHRDVSKSIECDLAGVKFDLDNVPTTGFKILPDYFMAYPENNSNMEHSYSIQDPRGFVIGLTRVQFIDLLNSVKTANGVIEDALVYSWKHFSDSGNPISVKFPILMSTNDPRYDEYVQNSRKMENDKKSKHNFKSFNDLTPGKIYSVPDISNPDGKAKYLYLGKTSRLDIKTIQKLGTFAYVTNDARSDERMSKFKSFSLGCRSSSYGSYWYSECFTKFPWENDSWKRFLLNDWENKKIKPEENVFLSLSGYSTKRLVEISKSFKNGEYVPGLNIQHVYNFLGCITAKITVKSIIEEEEPTSYSTSEINNQLWSDFALSVNKNLIDYFNIFVEKTIANFPSKDKLPTDSEEAYDFKKAWKMTPYEQNYFTSFKNQ